MKINFYEHIEVARLNEAARIRQTRAAWDLQNTSASNYGDVMVMKEKLQNDRGRLVSPKEVNEALEGNSLQTYLSKLYR